MLSVIKTSIDFKIKNSKGLLSEMRERYEEYLKKDDNEKENPLKEHMEKIKRQIGFSFYQKRGNFLDINI